MARKQKNKYQVGDTVFVVPQTGKIAKMKIEEIFIKYYLGGPETIIHVKEVDRDGSGGCLRGYFYAEELSKMFDTKEEAEKYLKGKKR